ncbi:MAG: response regulator, partial [Gammaproteobacteria bacterium]|nr:response regulator [Gammaproteobacteria bacterium]
SIVQNLVERMGGEIGFDSKVNIGTTLWFTLPLIKNNDGAQLLIPDSIKGKSIALIDQNPTSRLSIKHMLTDAGISVHEYTDIAKTTSIFKSQPDINLDAVIISCNRLSMRLITSSLLNDIHELTHSEILVLVPTNDNKTILSITKTGADLCVSKPVFRDRLYQTLSGLLNKKSFPEYETKEPDITTSKNICNLNVLIAEDNEINATLLSAILKQHGSTISIASNGKIVLDLLSSSRFDVILMDINMPVLDGINTTKMIRENCEYYPCNIPIIAITANALEKDRVRFKTAGINDLLIKPITEEAVWEAIMKHVKCDCTIDDFITDDISKLIPDDLYSRVKIEVSEHTQIIITALKQNDMDTLFTHAHKLNGLASYFNIPAVREVVDKLETALKNKNGRTEIESYVERLHSEVAKIDN